MIYVHVNENRCRQDIAPTLLVGTKGKEERSSAGSKATEEMLTEVSNAMFDAIIMQDKSTYNLQVQQLMEHGMTKEEAEKKAFGLFVGQVALAGAGGALSGGVMGGIANLGAYAVNNMTSPEIAPIKDEVTYIVEDICSMVDRDPESGKPIYEATFPKGTPKREKGKHILDLIQTQWSKKPIALTIPNEDGTTRTIYAQFDPTYSEDENAPTDASKLMGGNRHGSASEKRVTLDLAENYYQIASEAKYNYSKNETGKDSDTHENVKL